MPGLNAIGNDCIRRVLPLAQQLISLIVYFLITSLLLNDGRRKFNRSRHGLRVMSSSGHFGNTLAHFTSSSLPLVHRHVAQRRHHSLLLVLLKW